MPLLVVALINIGVANAHFAHITGPIISNQLCNINLQIFPLSLVPLVVIRLLLWKMNLTF